MSVLELSPTDFQSQMLWGLVFLVQIPRARVPTLGPDLHAPQGRPLVPVISLPFVGQSLRSLVPCCMPAPPILLSIVFFLFISIAVEKVFC